MAEKFYGISSDEAIGKLISEIVSVDVGDTRFTQVLSTIHAQGEHRYDSEIMIDGERRRVSSRLAGIFDAKGSLIGYARFSRDISNSVAAEEALRELSLIEERNRLARNLHDSMTQSIHSLSLTAKTSRSMMDKERYQSMHELLDILVDGTEQAHKELRLLLHELQVVPDEETDLIDILRTRLENVEQRVGVATNLQVDGMWHVEKAVEIEIYYIAQEALNNALKHADVSEININILGTPARVEMLVTDNGGGFSNPLNGQIELEAMEGLGMGIPNMVSRAEKIGGNMHIVSNPGDGTEIHLIVEI